METWLIMALIALSVAIVTTVVVWVILGGDDVDESKNEETKVSQSIGKSVNRWANLVGRLRG